MSEIPSTLDWPLLAWLQWLPLAGAALLYGLGDRTAAVWSGRAVAALEVLLALFAFVSIDAADARLQLAERFDAIGYHVAIDAFSALFVLLAAVLVLLLTLYGLVRGLARPGRLLALILLAEAALMHILLTMNLLWFTLATLLELVVTAHLIGRWSTAPAQHKRLATLRFLQFQGVGLVMLAVGVLMLVWGGAEVSGRWSFDLFDLMQAPLGERFQGAAFFLLFYAFAVRTPLFPLHGWLPNVMQHGMVSVAPTLLLGAKVGIYGMLRFLLPLLPQAAREWSLMVVAFAMAGVYYAAVLALLQGNLRRLLSFAVISHSSLIIIGLFTLHPRGVAGAVLLSVNFGLAVTVMLFMVGFVYRRRRTTELARLGGLFERIPFIAACFFIGGLAVVGMPGTPGFDAVHLLLEAAMERFGALPTVLAALGNVLAAGFLLWAFQRAFLAPAAAAGDDAAATAAVDATAPMEYFVGALAVLLLLLAGFYFENWLGFIETSAAALSQLVGAGP